MSVPETVLLTQNVCFRRINVLLNTAVVSCSLPPCIKLCRCLQVLFMDLLFNDILMTAINLSKILVQTQKWVHRFTYWSVEPSVYSFGFKSHV